MIACSVHNGFCRCSVVVPNEKIFEMASKIAQKAMGRVHKGKEKVKGQKEEGGEEAKEEKEDTGKESAETDGVHSEQDDTEKQNAAKEPSEKEPQQSGDTLREFKTTWQGHTLTIASYPNGIWRVRSIPTDANEFEVCGIRLLS